MKENAQVRSGYFARFLLGFLSAFVLVALSNLAVGGKGIEAKSLLAGTIGTFILSIAAAAMTAPFFRKDLWVALAAQLVTICLMAVIQFWA